MFFILVSISVFIFIYNWTRKKDWDYNHRLTVLVIVGIICVVTIPVGLFAPIHGYDEKQCVKETELIELRSEEKGTWYVYKSKIADYSIKKYLYAFDNMESYELEGQAYEEDYITSGGDEIKVYESDECDKPVLKKFVSKGKSGIFSFAIGTNNVEYVFFIPTGTVLEEKQIWN